MKIKIKGFIFELKEIEMSDFEKWFLSNGIPLDTDFNVAKRAFEAGQQAQQAKIDELQARIDSLTNINESLVAYKNQLLDEIEEKGNKDEN